MRLLVVDDDRGLRDVLRRALTLSGYEVRVADSGSEALAEVASGVPDAVVLDIGLPDIDGLDVCRLLRREGNRVPVLMLTARDAVSDRIDGLDAGADDYLVKPFDVDELRARLRALLRRAGGIRGLVDADRGSRREPDDVLDVERGFAALNSWVPRAGIDGDSRHGRRRAVTGLVGRDVAWRERFKLNDADRHAGAERATGVQRVKAVVVRQLWRGVSRRPSRLGARRRAGQVGIQSWHEH